MDALDNIKTRRSIREYLDKDISKDILEKIVDAGHFAATARNIQPWNFVIVTDKKILREIASLAENARFLAQAAACIAVFCEDTKYYLEDASAATENMLLAASALGVGSCWVAGDKKPYCSKVGDLVAAPGPLKLASIVALGYPKSAAASRVTEKKELKGLIHWERF